jgi:hypothetical protein
MYRYEGNYWFRARYKVPRENTFGIPAMPRGAQFVCNFRKNDYVRIKHPNLAYCYREASRYADSLGNLLIKVVAAFPSGVFEGYWNYFEPSNDRPVLQLHDASPFFLLQDGKTLEKQIVTLKAIPKTSKKSKEEIDYLEYCTGEQSAPPLKFSVVNDIKRKISDAAFIEKIKVGILGNLQEDEDA